MEYILIFALQLIGIGLHVGLKIMEIDKRDSTDSPKQVAAIFLGENWPTLFVSGIIIILNLVTHFILGAYSDLPTRVPYYVLWAFAIALLLGYAGNRLVYRYLGALESGVTKKVEALLNIQEVAATKAENTLNK